MAYGFAVNIANILPADLESVKLKAIGDDAYYNVGPIQNGVIKAEALHSDDSLKRQRPIKIVKLEVNFRIMATPAVLMEGIGTLGTNRLQFKAVTVGGKAFSSELISATTGWFGCKAKVLSDNDADSNRYIEVSLMRRITFAEWQLMLGAAPADGVADAGDVLYPLFNALDPEDIFAAGLTDFKFKETAGGAYDDNAGIFRNGKFTYELVTSPDGLKREVAHGVNANVEVELMQTSAEAALLDNLAADSLDYQLTTIDAIAMTFDDKLGIKFNYENPEGTENKAFIKLMASGFLDWTKYAAIWP